ncbi:Cardiolipin synthase A [Buchnera aphidicola (Tetraneura ulmi)]|uniref:cardiolipin synthase n=1 Tax=Buchnera aphidicola TaxID=9 RepID=UPI003464CAF0
MNNCHHFYSWIVFIGYLLLIVNVNFKIFIKKKTNPVSNIWIFILYFIPLFGIMIWFFFSEPYLGKRKTNLLKKIWKKNLVQIKKIKYYKNFFSKKNSRVALPLFKLCKNRQGISGVTNNKLELLKNYKKVIKSLIKDISLAKKNIEMVFYIWQPGGIADEVAKALISSSKKGINCRLILDSAGSIKFFKSKWVYVMKKANIKIVEALKINVLKTFFRRIDSRQHRKVVLIDNNISYIGSMNLVDPNLFKQYCKIGQWIDLMIRVEGPIVTTIGIVYSCDWELETGKKILPKLFISKNKEISKKNYSTSMQVIASGPGYTKQIIHQSLLTAIYSAKNQLTITTPYLVPSSDLVHAICTASYRGVNVSIIIPKNNDSFMVKWASRSFFSELLKSGVKIYLFEKGLLHSKSILVDKQLSLVGTANLDMRSLWLNFEITIAIDDKKFGKKLSYLHDEYISKSKLLDPKYWFLRSYWKKIIENFFYLFSPLL